MSYKHLIFLPVGIVLKGQSRGPEMKYYPFELKMEDDTNNYFKSVFPYKGRVCMKTCLILTLWMYIPRIFILQK